MPEKLKKAEEIKDTKKMPAWKALGFSKRPSGKNSAREMLDNMRKAQSKSQSESAYSKKAVKPKKKKKPRGFFDLKSVRRRREKAAGL